MHRRSAPALLWRQQTNPRTAERNRLAVLILAFESRLGVMRQREIAAPARPKHHRGVAGDPYGLGILADKPAVEEVLPLSEGDADPCIRDQMLVVIPGVRVVATGEHRHRNAAVRNRLRIDLHMKTEVR